MNHGFSPEDYGTTEPTIAEVCQQLHDAEGDQFGDVISQLTQSLTALEAKLNNLPDEEQEAFIQRSQAELNAVSVRPSALAWLRRAQKAWRQLHDADRDQFVDVSSHLAQSLSVLEAKVNRLQEEEQEAFIRRSQAELNAVSAKPSAIAWFRRAKTPHPESPK